MRRSIAALTEAALMEKKMSFSVVRPLRAVWGKVNSGAKAVAKHMRKHRNKYIAAGAAALVGKALHYGAQPYQSRDARGRLQPYVSGVSAIMRRAKDWYENSPHAQTTVENIKSSIGHAVSQAIRAHARDAAFDAVNWAYRKALGKK